MKASIVVPTYEMRGNGPAFLQQLLSTIKAQDYKNYEVIVSDDSKDDAIRKLCEIESSSLDLKYFKNPSSTKRSTVNLNNAIENSSGDFIKVVCQDDFFFTKECLGRIANAHENGAFWTLTSYVHTNDCRQFFKHHVPSFYSKGYDGENLAGSPTALSFMRSTPERFDERLFWLMDCDFYHRLYLRHGNPHIISEPGLVVRLWEGQNTNDANEGVKASETCYVWRKYND